MTAYLNAGARQFGFMIRGLRELEARLDKMGIPFFLLKGDPTETIPKLVKGTGAAALVTDFGPLRLGRQWRETVLFALHGPFEQSIDNSCIHDLRNHVRASVGIEPAMTIILMICNMRSAVLASCRAVKELGFFTLTLNQFSASRLACRL